MGAPGLAAAKEPMRLAGGLNQMAARAAGKRPGTIDTEDVPCSLRLSDDCGWRSTQENQALIQMMELLVRTSHFQA